jgi:hypothetical protein
VADLYDDILLGWNGSDKWRGVSAYPAAHADGDASKGVDEGFEAVGGILVAAEAPAILAL